MVTLSDMSTRELIRALRSADWFDADHDHETYVGKRLVAGGIEQRVFGKLSDVRDELAKRPHVPNKQEGRIIRRIQSQTGMSVEEIRRTPKYQDELIDATHPNRRLVSPDWAKQFAPFYGSVFNKLFKVVQ